MFFTCLKIPFHGQWILHASSMVSVHLNRSIKMYLLQNLFFSHKFFLLETLLFFILDCLNERRRLSGKLYLLFFLCFDLETSLLTQLLSKDFSHFALRFLHRQVWSSVLIAFHNTPNKNIIVAFGIHLVFLSPILQFIIWLLESTMYLLDRLKTVFRLRLNFSCPYPNVIKTQPTYCQLHLSRYYL